jgi:hypothetical protein
MHRNIKLHKINQQNKNINKKMDILTTALMVIPLKQNAFTLQHTKCQHFCITMPTSNANIISQTTCAIDEN